MTVPEQAGKVATSVVEGLKTNPSCLAAILLAGIFAFLTYIGLQREAERSQRRLEGVVKLLDRCMEPEHGAPTGDELRGLLSPVLLDRVRDL